MRPSFIYFKSRNHAKAAQNPDKVPIREISPLILKNRVQGSSEKNMHNKCLYEMSLLFRCWKENNFGERACETYVQNLQKCYANLITTTAVEKEFKKSDIPIPGAKSYTSKQITYLLKKYPTV